MFEKFCEIRLIVITSDIWGKKLKINEAPSVLDIMIR